MCKKPIICLFLIWHVLGPLKTFISACARLCVCQNESECMREIERERGGGGEGAIHVLLIHSILLLLLFFSFFLYFTCSIRILDSLQV